MRPLYLFLRITLPYALAVYYRKTKSLNAQKKFNAQTIFVCNHPSAFIDPLVAANFQRPVLYFVTRGDIFSWWLHPVTWASHMVPIFRKEQDGADSHEKNKDSFTYLRKTLMRKKSLILFGEGLTDDVFIRSLKTIKKGPARIGFETMVENNWEEDIKIQPIGINYTHPKHSRSDVLVSFGDLIPLKEYKELYEENPKKAVTTLTRRVQKGMQDQITYVDNKDLAPFVEHLLILSRKGMNNFHFDRSVSLESRFKFSRNLAATINEQYNEEEEKWPQLKADLETYFEQQKKDQIDENWVANYSKKGNKGIAARLPLLILGWPVALLGAVHNFIPYILIKRFVENTFKRDVFWSGVKMILGTAASALINIPVIFLFHNYVYESYLLGLAYYLTVPALSGVFAYNYFKKFGDTLRLNKADDKKLASYVEKRKGLIARIKEMQLF